MELLLSFLASSSSKWIAILLTVLSVGGYIYYSKVEYGKLQKQVATYEYNLNQLSQALKDEQVQRKSAEEINSAQSNIINSIIKERDELEKKMKEVEIEIEKEVVKGNDRPSSNILKETIKRLSGQQ